MSEALDLSALAALRIVQATSAVAEAARPAAWLRAIDVLTTPPAPVMACYRLDAAGEVLRPLAALGVAPARLPEIAATQLEHPLVYALTRGEACLIDAMGALVDEGAQALAVAMKRMPALLAIPLRGRTTTILALAGSPTQLRAFRRHDAWTAMLEVAQRLFAPLCDAMPAEVAPARKRDASVSEREAADARVQQELIGVSIAARSLRADVLAAAESPLSLLISGETGVGKDHAAWLIHQVSARRHKAFVPLNCAAIAPELIAAELFGAAKGAYTGADRARAGLVAAADGGTLFLDEIGDMPMPLQATLLRLLNEKRYRPLGEIEERSSDFRLICASHQPLAQRIREGRFREDLYFRIRQLSLRIPPLRERRADIPLLAEHVIARHNREQRGYVTGLSDDAARVLAAHAFPGNVRELISLVRVACERVTGGKPIDAPLLMELLQAFAVEDEAASAPLSANLAHWLATGDLVQACDEFERHLIALRLSQHRGSRLHAARSLGIPKRTLAYKCKKYSLDIEP